MTSNVSILTTGYATLQDDSRNKFMRATGSCCLVSSSGEYIIFDTMGPWERDELLAKLENLKVHADDVKYVVCSHSHPDHIGNINLFLQADRHFVGTSVYHKDTYHLDCFEPTGSYEFKRPSQDSSTTVIRYQNFNLDSNLVLEPTPGHTMECITLVVNNCVGRGTVALAGDLFENENDIHDETIWLGAGSQSPDLQRAHRSQIYNKVDFVVPGHGSIFKTDRSITV